MVTLGQRIKQLRKEHNMTQEEFGKLFGIVKSTVSLYEHDKSIPDDSIKKMIADYFNVSIDYLMGRTDIRYPAKKTIDDKLKEVIGPYIASQIIALESLSQEEKQTISVLLDGLKARRQTEDKEG
ncbi:helix-turn-helix domain-containing protein [Mahella australiensis]|uniref:Helix-turn-helix domain protein n=1 Tax=Mahella australiensis (strain DSM 15567 / CIP 107919 / 50-1 BON) TaxID=697281 RepID=F3ZY14_MAHA5|nr:helix-turn-helix transcriptional regulator [Mahella australiensis]AEE97710.1 helix-turn-helix domain protein [Mahella australiensis 50-1 BON]